MDTSCKFCGTMLDLDPEVEGVCVSCVQARPHWEVWPVKEGDHCWHEYYQFGKVEGILDKDGERKIFCRFERELGPEMYWLSQDEVYYALPPQEGDPDYEQE